MGLQVGDLFLSGFNTVNLLPFNLKLKNLSSTELPHAHDNDPEVV